MRAHDVIGHSLRLARGRKCPKRCQKLLPLHDAPKVPIPWDEAMSALACALMVMLAVLVSGFLYLRHKWPKQYDRLVEQAFNRASKGRGVNSHISKDELFTSVLFVHAELNYKGLKVPLPKRDHVEDQFDAMLALHNRTSSGPPPPGISFDDFRELMVVLGLQVYGKAAAQLSLGVLKTVAVPLVIGIGWSRVQSSLSSWIMEISLLELIDVLDLTPFLLIKLVGIVIDHFRVYETVLEPTVIRRVKERQQWRAELIVNGEMAPGELAISPRHRKAS